MKNSTILKMTAALAIMFLGYANSWGQTELGMPAGLHEHGKNSADMVVAKENIDSVALGADLKYWAKPDPLVALPTNTYTWSFYSTKGSQTAGGNSNIATVTFNNGLGIDTLKVIENSTAGCPGTISKIPFEVINQPTFSIKTGSTSSNVCLSAFPAVTVSIPITLVTSIASPAADALLKIKYKINDGTTDIYTSATFETANYNPGDNTLAIPKANFGTVAVKTYTITILAVNDRISRKSTTALNGSLTSGGVASYVYTVLPVPVTGPIYHLPNN